jgi:hypothetical protein
MVKKVKTTLSRIGENTKQFIVLVLSDPNSGINETTGIPQVAVDFYLKFLNFCFLQGK